MYNSHYRLFAGNSPTLLNKHSLTYDTKLDIHEQIQLLEEEWGNLEMHQENSMQQIQKIFDKIDSEVSRSKERVGSRWEQQIDNLDRHLTITVNIQKESMLESNKKLKDYVVTKQRIIEEILEGQVKEEEIFQKQVSGIIDKRIEDIRKKLVKPTPPIERSKFTKKKQPQSTLKSKLSQKIKIIEEILTQNKQDVKKMKRESEKMIREYLKVKDQIEDARADREDKQQEILAKIEELCVGDRTKEETMIKIQ